MFFVCSYDVLLTAVAEEKTDFTRLNNLTGRNSR